jgi:hypothetical protein
MSYINACERFFRLYYKYNLNYDKDSLYNLFNSIHSLNDILKKEKNLNLFDINEFTLIKALRNYYHHQGELNNNIKILNMEELPISSDLRYLCLIPKELVYSAIEKIDSRFRGDDEKKIYSIIKFYENYVNINPTIFNLSVKIYEKLLDNDIILNTSDYLELKKSYDFETKNNHSHYVTGEIFDLPKNSINILTPLN